MSNTIDFGIDLGTTNSAIARFLEGEVEVFEDPRAQGKSVLPSVVGFRRDKTIVGDKARELLGKKGPYDAVGKFKRKMGTSESFRIDSIDQSKTPVDLSAHVLKRLKEFIRTGERLDAAVITIPASFDTVQSNATKEAGRKAGMEQVELLQEPIAASLAYANQSRSQALDEGHWVVYDMGGGTFDVALMHIQNGEMKVVDHEGDNFLGGADFDQLLVEEAIIPRLEELGTFSGLESKMKSEKGAYNDKYHRFLLQAEDAKIELSAVTSTEIEIENIQDEAGNDLFDFMTLTRSEFEAMIQPQVDRTIEMINEMLVRNSLTPNDLAFVLMVGGSTYIPYVRQRVEEVIGAPVNCEVDPTTAVAIGAAYYAGSKSIAVEDGADVSENDAVDLKVKLAYHEASQDEYEFVAARFSGDTEGLYYRITRNDGGFDTGLKPLQSKITEDLPLIADAYNYFELTVYDEQNNVVATNAERIGIAQGKYGVAGQPLPHDISLERDDPETETTYLDLIFEKNRVLPLRRTKRVTVNKTVAQGSEDSYKIRVVEGPHHAAPESGKTIGYLEIEGDMLSRDVLKGSDLDIMLEMSESRDLTVRAEVKMTDQEFQEVFSPKEREAPVSVLKAQVSNLADRIETEVEAAVENEDYEVANKLRSLQQEVGEIESRASTMAQDDVTDDRYQLQDRARKLSQRIDEATKDKHLRDARQEYEEAKARCAEVVNKYGNDEEQQLFEGIVAQESTFLSSSSTSKIRRQADEMGQIAYSILWRTPGFLQETFRNLEAGASRMNNQEQARNLIESGRLAIEKQNWDRLAEVNYGLVDLLPRSAQSDYQGSIGF